MNSSLERPVESPRQRQVDFSIARLKTEEQLSEPRTLAQKTVR